MYIYRYRYAYMCKHTQTIFFKCTEFCSGGFWAAKKIQTTFKLLSWYAEIVECSGNFGSFCLTLTNVAMDQFSFFLTSCPRI